VDSRRDTPRIAGDLRAAIDAGAVQADDVHAELRELVLGRRPDAGTKASSPSPS